MYTWGTALMFHAEGRRRLLVFLDLDDVVVLNETVGGYDVALALGKPVADDSTEPPTKLWEQLMSRPALALLRQIDEEFRPLYVLSTSWARVMDDAALREMLQRSGLGFVAENLHVDMTTATGRKPNTRWNEIAAWVATHPEFADRWVVLDDELSGTGLEDAKQVAAAKPFVVLCKAHVGITQSEYEQVRAALLTRVSAF